jgi:hypothetical protein
MKKYISRDYFEEGLKPYFERVFDTIDLLRTLQNQRADVSPEERKQLDKAVDNLAFSALLKSNDFPNRSLGGASRTRDANFTAICNRIRIDLQFR